MSSARVDSRLVDETSTPVAEVAAGAFFAGPKGDKPPIPPTSLIAMARPFAGEAGIIGTFGRFL
jgi:hypothetical protein